MAIILFAIGVYLYFTQRFRLRSLQTEGRHVRAAGAVLMTPASLTFLLSFIVGMIFAGSPETLISFIGMLALVEMISLVVAVVVAYILLADPQNAPHLPGVLGQIQDERRRNPGLSTARPNLSRSPSTHPLGGQRATQARTILTVSEAAEYMGMTEPAIVDWIETGRLAAARVNYSYRIARSILDDLKAEQKSARADSLQ